MTPVRALFLTVMPTPYWQELFAQFRLDGRVCPLALYLTHKEPNTHWDDPLLPAGESVLEKRLSHFFSGSFDYHPALCRSLLQADADIYVVGGYATHTFRVAMRCLSKHGKPWIFFGERPGVAHRGKLAHQLRRVVLKPVTRNAAAIAAVGQAAVSAYRDLGFSRKPIRNIPYFTDLAPFVKHPSSAGQLVGRFRILFCGQLIERKGVDILLTAFRHIAEIDQNAELVLAGEGPLRQELEASVPTHLQSKVRFIGFQPVTRLPDVFSEADVFVLPSRHDGWGVVVNQALAAGLPVIASDAVGAAQDFVAGRDSGVVVPAGDSSALAEALLRLAEDPATLRRQAAQALVTARDLCLTKGVDAWSDLFHEVLDTHATTHVTTSGFSRSTVAPTGSSRR